MFNNLSEQNEKLIEIISANEDLMNIIEFLYNMKIPNFYIAAGSVYQSVWNYMDGFDLMHNISDIDIIYCDEKNLDKDTEDKLCRDIESLFKNKKYEIDVHNEARMHLWKKDNENPFIDHYENSEDAIGQWIATVQAVGITKDEEGLKVFAPYGLSDIFSKTIRPIKHSTSSQKLYEKKCDKWKKKFTDIDVIEW